MTDKIKYLKEVCIRYMNASIRGYEELKNIAPNAKQAEEMSSIIEFVKNEKNQIEKYK